MRLNTIKPAAGSKSPRHRVGRGIGSGWGKTAGRGHKGQKSRAGGFHKVGFEGGQMPLHRRLPKRGFKSATRRYVEVVRLSDLQGLDAAEVDLLTLKQAGIVSIHALDARVVLSGELKRKVSVRGIGVTKGARVAIEAAGGTIAAAAAPAADAKPGKRLAKAQARAKARAEGIAKAAPIVKAEAKPAAKAKKADAAEAKPKGEAKPKAEGKGKAKA